MTTILWVDDEIDHLRSHILFLEKRGYRVLKARSGRKALEMLSENRVDLVLMDQMMVGMDGLQTVTHIKESYADLPVVMVTQSEEEELMDQALGLETDDYLTKPVNPSQVLLVIKRLLTGEKLRSAHALDELASEAGELLKQNLDEVTPEHWFDFYGTWVRRDVAHGSLLEDEARAIQKTRFDALALEFSKYVEHAYPQWIANESEAPLMPHSFLQKVVLPNAESSSETVLIVMDCMRLDQWLVMYSAIEGLYHQDLGLMFTSLPSSTPYSRNAMFSGLLPRDIWRFYRKKWSEEYGAPGLNKYEPEFMRDALKRLGFPRPDDAGYVKILGHRDGDELRKNVSHLLQGGLLAIVVSFLDHLTHDRSESELLKDLAPDVDSFRNLAGSWFRGSFLLKLFQTFAARGAKVIVTSDHGSILSRRTTHIQGGRGMSSSVRYRIGHSLHGDPKTSILIDEPALWGLPDDSSRKSYLLARSDYLLMHQAVPRSEMYKFLDTFQHGGVSMQEMIVPVAVLTPKRMG